MEKFTDIHKITLRAWYDKSQTWVYVTVGQPMTDNAKNIYEDMCLDGVQWFRVVGHTDRTNKGLWEGNIVECNGNHHGKETGLVFMAKIVYNNDIGAFQIAYKNDQGVFVRDSIYGKYFIEIKGTTTENPELLK